MAATIEARIGDDGRTTVVAVSNIDPGPHHAEIRLQKADNLGEYGPVSKNWHGEHAAWIFDNVYEEVRVVVDGGDTDKPVKVGAIGANFKAKGKKAAAEAKVEGIEPGIFDGDDIEGAGNIAVRAAGEGDGTLSGTAERGSKPLDDLARTADGKVNEPRNPAVVVSDPRAGVNAGVPDEENVAADPNRDANPFNDMPDGDPRRAGQNKGEPSVEDVSGRGEDGNTLNPNNQRPEGAWAAGIDPDEGRLPDGTLESNQPRKAVDVDAGRRADGTIDQAELAKAIAEGGTVDAVEDSPPDDVNVGADNNTGIDRGRNTGTDSDVRDDSVSEGETDDNKPGQAIDEYERNVPDLDAKDEKKGK